MLEKTPVNLVDGLA